jgi:hypothetical protein
MEWLKRKSPLTNVLLAAIGLLMLDRIVLSPYLDWRDTLIKQRDSKIHAVTDAKSILHREKQLRQMLAGLGASITWDSSAAEGQLLHVMHAWEQSSGVTNASFQRLRTERQKGFTQLTFQIDAVGSLGSAATLLYCVETSPIPMRIEELEVRPRLEGGNLVQVYFKLTTPCEGNVLDSAASVASVASVQGTPE